MMMLINYKFKFEYFFDKERFESRSAVEHVVI